MKDILSFVFTIVAVVVILFLCYKFSKYMAERVNKITSSNNIKILERAALGQDKGLAIVEVCGKYYLMGFSNNDIEILKEIDNYIPSSTSPSQKSFLDVFKSTLTKKN